MLNNRLSVYFRQTIVPEQHGFLRGHSVDTNLYSFLHDVVLIVHSREQLDVSFAMTKAFDKVDHRLHLVMLKIYGMFPRYGNLFKSYLSKPENLLRVSGSPSHPSLATSRPQS